MLNKKRTAKWARLRLLLALPMATGMLCVSTLAFTKDYGYVDLLPEKANVQKPTEEVSDEVQLAKKGRYSPSYVFDENNQYKSLEKRLIVINGNLISDNNKYYGNSNADNIVFLKPKNAIEKYGVKGKYGAVEIDGKEPKLTFQPEYVIADTAKFPAPIPQKDQVKFPPPVVKQNGKQWFTPLYKKDAATGKPVLNEIRYILINGNAIKNLNTFYGVSNAESVRYLNNASAVAKYGDKGKNGAVEIKGKNIKYFDKITIPKLPPPVEPPPPGYKTKKDRVTFPPPTIRKDKTIFYPMRSVDKNGNVNSLDARIIVINGKKVENIETFFGVTNASNVVDIDAATAIKKYGKGAKYGAVEITGNNLKYVKSIADGPPPPVMEQTKFPPPVIKKSSTSSALKNETKVNGKVKYSFTSAETKPVYLNADDINAYPTRINISNVLDRSNGKKLIIPSKPSETKSISIFDRNGNKLFRDSNYTDDWAGYEGNLNDFDGKLLKLDTYYYMVAIKGANGKTNLAKGWFTII